MGKKWFWPFVGISVLAMTVLLAIKFSVAPTIPFWVTMLPLVPVGLIVGVNGFAFVMIALCMIVMFVFAVILTMLGSLVDAATHRR